MTIHVTENAAKQIRTQLAKRGHGIGLRVGVKETGCSGFAGCDWPERDATSAAATHMALSSPW